MNVAIETPVFKGHRLQRCIDSVLYQSSPDWTFWLLWDGGDEQSRRILEDLQAQNHPQVNIFFAENRGIARARNFLSAHSKGDYILALDDDDALPFNAIERFLEAAAQKPWASVIRAQRIIMDDEGLIVDTPPWFPFEPRHYQLGMVTDIMNHTHPYLIRRSAYDRTSGWEGFEDFGFAGEDCDVYLKLEEQGTIELLPETLYYYRLHNQRASLVLTDKGAYEMWRRLADKTIERIGLPLKRTNERPLFEYQKLARPEPTPDMVDVLTLPNDAASLDAAVRAGSRPLLLLVDQSLAAEAPGMLPRLLAELHRADADLASPRLLAPDGTVAWADPAFEPDKRPVARGAGQADQPQYHAVTPARWLTEKLLLARREVVRAVGGIDGGFADTHTAVVDFCLRARQRQFTCSYLGNVAVNCGAAMGRTSDASLDRLQKKWAVYPQLFA